MDTKSFRDTYVELERLHSKIMQTEQEIYKIDLAIDKINSWIVESYDENRINSPEYRLDSILSKRENE